MKQIIFISLLCVCAISCIDLDTKSTAAIGSAQMWTTEDLADAELRVSIRFSTLIRRLPLFRESRSYRTF